MPPRTDDMVRMRSTRRGVHGNALLI